MAFYLEDELYKLIRKDREIFDFIQEGSLDGLWYWDLEHPENEWMSPRFWQVLGYDPKDMPHKTSAWQNIINQDDLKVAIDNFNKHLENPNHPYDQEVRYTHKNGSTVWVRCRGIAIRDKSGKAIRMLGAHQEITALKKSQQQYRDSEERHKLLVDKISELVCEIDEQGVYTYVNNQYNNILGYTPEELLGHSATELIHPDDLAASIKKYEKLKEIEATSTDIWRFKHKNGEYRIIESKGTVYTDSNNVKRTVVISRDITEQKKAEKKLFEAKVKAEQSEIKLIESVTDLKLAQQIANIGNWQFDPTIGKPEWSDYIFKIYERNPEDGVPHLDEYKKMYEPNQFEIFNHAISAAINKGKAYNIELKLNLPSGKQKWIHAICKPDLNKKTAKGYFLRGTIQDITKRKLIEEELLKAKQKAINSERKFKSYTEQSPIAIYVTDIKGDCIYANNNWLQMAGMKLDEALGNGWVNAIHPDDREFVNKNWYKAVESQGKWNYEYRFIDKLNNVTWVQGTAKALYDEHNELIGYLGSNLNINHRKEAEKSLQNSEARYRNLVETSSDAIYLINETGYIIDTNDVATKMLGKSRKEIVNQPINHVDPNFTLNAFLEFWHETPFDEPRIFETTHRTKKGKLIPVEVSGKKFRIDEQVFYYGVARDISERKQVEHTLRESEEKFRGIFEYANVGITISDKEGNQLDVNSEMLNLLGYTRNEFLGKNFAEFTHPDDLYKDLDLLQKINNNELSQYTVEKRLISKTGNVVWVNVSITAHRDETGRVDMIIAMVLDITKRVIASRALKESNKQLEQAKEKAEYTKELLTHVTDNILDMVSITDTNGIFKYVSNSHSLLGYKPAQLMGKNCFKLVHPDDAEYVNAEFSKFIIDKSIPKTEFRCRNAQGEYVWVETIAKVINDQELLFSTRIISERKANERILSEAKQKAEQKNLINEARLKLIKHSDSYTEDELIELALNEAEKISQSKIAFYHYVDEDQKTLTLHYWSTSTKQHFGNVEEKSIQYTFEKKGVMVECINERKPVIHNNSSALLNKKDLPEGNIELIRQLVVPVICDEKLCALVGVSNKEKDYTEADVESVSQLAYFVFEIIYRKRTSEELHKAKLNIEESEARFKALHNASFGGITIHDKGIILDCNKGLSDITGYSYEELTGMDGLLLIAESKRDFVMSQILKGFEEPYEAIGLRKDGTEYPLRLEARNIPYKGKQVRTVEFRDISDQKKYEQELKQSRDEIVLKNEISNAFIISNKLEFFELVLNIALKTLNSKYGFFGYMDKNQTLICPAFKLEQNQTQPAIRSNSFSKDMRTGVWGECLKSKSCKYVNSKQIIVNGYTQAMNAMAAPVMFRKKIIGVITIANKQGDYTKSDSQILDKISKYISPLLNAAINEMLYKEELIAAKLKAEQSDRLKTEFLHNMSHEIRTPMNGIMGFSNMLNKKGISDDKRQFYTKIIQSSSNQLLRIIDDILEISTLETKQIQADFKQLNLNQFLMEMFSIFDLKAKERNIPLYLKKGMPDDKSELFIDKTKLNKILGNLLENALKFTHEGYIELGYYVDKTTLTIYVKDTGIGISPENTSLIFERFRQEDVDIASKHGGLGLGLSISKENANIMGGDITLESEKGKGSVFYVNLPFKPASAEFGNSVAKNELLQAALGKHLTILVAEDEEINYLFIEEVLLDQDEFEVCILHAKNGREAVELCKHNKVDIVLMDIKMPVMGGLEATKEIKSLFLDLPIIAQTAYSTQEDKNIALAAGCNEFLSKPLDRVILFKLIKQYTQ